MSLATLLVNTCSLTPVDYAQSTASGGLGNPPASADQIGVACNIQVASGSESVSHARETGQRIFECYFGSSVTITHRYLISNITGSSIAGLSGVVLEVISPPQDHSGRGTYKMVIARELDT